MPAVSQKDTRETNLKLLCIGAGSIGKRHIANALAMGCSVVAADPYASAIPGVLWYTDWETMMADHADTAQAAIISSPTAAHFNQARRVLASGLPVYLEKPAVAVADVDAFRAMIEQAPKNVVMRSCVGFQYRCHPQFPQVQKLARSGYLHFEGKDRLLSRYGKDVAGVMVAHPIHTALHFLGPAMSAHLTSDGIRLSGSVLHAGGNKSYYNFNMDYDGPRESWVCGDGRDVALNANDDMYIDYLKCFVSLARNGWLDLRLAALVDGLRVSEVLRQVHQTEPA